MSQKINLSILFLILTNLFALNALAVREMKVKLVLVADTGGLNESKMTPEHFKAQVDYANDVYKNTVQFLFDPKVDVIKVKNTLINRDFELQPGETVNGKDRTKDYKHRVNSKRYTHAKNSYARSLGNVLVVFSARGNQMTWDKVSLTFSETERQFAYSNTVDQYVMMTWGNTNKQALFAHEVGHYLGLGHTQAASPLNDDDLWQEVFNAFENGYKGVLDKIFDGDGWRVSDTPADPGPDYWAFQTGNACGPVDTVTTKKKLFGTEAKITFQPDRRNVMSYFDGCNWPEKYHISNSQKISVLNTIEFGARQRLWSKSSEETSSLSYFNAELDITSWSMERIDIVAAGTDGTLKQTSLEGSKNFTAPIDYFKTNDLPDIPWWNMEHVTEYAPSIIARAPGQLDVFVVSKGELKHRYYREDLGTWSNWKAIQSGSFVGKAALVNVNKDQIGVFVRSTNGKLYYFVMNGLNVSPLVDLGGPVFSDPSVVSWQPGRMDVVVRGSNKVVLHKSFQNGAWSPSVDNYNNLGGQIQGKPQITSWGPDRLDFVVRGMDNQIYHKAWVGNGWYPSLSGWNSLGGNATTSPTITSYKKNGLAIAANFNGKLGWKYWDGNGWTPKDKEWNLGSNELDPQSPVKAHSRGTSRGFHLFYKGISGEIINFEKNPGISENENIVGRML